MAICAYSWLFAAYRVLLRLPVPRHSPYALISLTFFRYDLSISIFGSLNKVILYIVFVESPKSILYLSILVTLLFSLHYCII